MSSFLACTNCHEVVVKGMGDEVKIRAKVLLVRAGQTYAVCKGCGDELEVPLRLDTDLHKALEQAKVRLYLKK